MPGLRISEGTLTHTFSSRRGLGLCMGELGLAPNSIAVICLSSPFIVLSIVDSVC